MSNCKIFRNRDNSINKVMDEFGNESQLYQDTLFHVSTLVDNIPMTPPVKHYLDKGDIMDTSVSEIALGLWAYSYSDHFRNKYNITKSSLEEVSVDDIIRHIEEYYPKSVTETSTVIPEQRVVDIVLNPIESINDLNKDLENYLSQFGFTTEQLDSLKETTGYSIIGATDFLEKTIFVQKENLNKAYTKEASYAIFNLLGRKNLLRKDLIASIHLIDNYESLKSKYINSKLSDYKIRELIAVDYLQSKLTAAHKEALSTSNKILSKDVTAKNKLEYTILKIKQWWSNIVRNFFKSYKRDYIENVFNQIANDVINNNTRLFNLSKNISYSKIELKDNYKEINNNLVEFGAINSGSYSLNRQGTLTRESINDLDYFLPYNIKDDFIKKVIKKYPNVIFSKPYSGVMGNRSLTLSLKIDDVKIDLFLPTSQEESDKNKIIIIDGNKYHHWKNIFDAKIRIGSQKHLSDLAGFVPFQKENLIYNKTIEDKNNEIDDKIESIKTNIQYIIDNFSWGTTSYSKKYDLENKLENLIKQKESFISERDVSLNIVGQRHYNFDFIQSKFNKIKYSSSENVNISNDIKSYLDKNLEQAANNYFRDNNIDFKKSIQYQDILSYFNNEKDKAIVAYYLTFSENFKKFYGNIESRKNLPSFIINSIKGNYSKPSILLDENNEPVIFYHGAGTNFDKFSKDYFLSGEGAMAYGAGFYSTNYKPTADNYRDTSKAAYQTFQKLLEEGNEELLKLIKDIKVDITEANINLSLQPSGRNIFFGNDIDSRTKLLELLGLTETKALYISLTNPLYWQKEISKENKELIETNFNVKLKNKQSGQIYRELEKTLKISDKELSSRLYQIGIDGVINIAGGGQAVGGFSHKKGEKHVIFFEPIQSKAINNSGIFSLNNENMYDPIDIKEQRFTNKMLNSSEEYSSDIFINTFKESIAELLKSNPELADKIYEKFAFVLNDNNENNIIIKEFNRIKKSDEYELLDEELNTILKMPDGYIDESLNKFKIIARIIKDKLQGFPIKVYYKENEKKDNILGVYSEYFQTIVMYDNKNITSKISTLLHEATHALTLGSLIKSELGITDKKFYDSITSYRQIVSEEIKKKGYPPFTYQLSNNEEFLSAVFSEHEFRDILKSIPSTKKDNKTLWEDILDLIKELIGIDGKNTILEDIINDTLDNLQDFKIKKVNVLMNLEQKRKAQELYSQYLEQKSDKNDLSGFTEFIRNSLLLETPIFIPETKSKTELLDEFNRLVEVSEKMGNKYPDDAINKIKSFLQELNFDLSTVDEVLARRGLTDKPKAVIDFAYNMIAFADGATVEDFAEEIGHIITLHAPQDRDLELALEAIKGTQIYKDNYLDYVKTYSKPGLALEMSPERKAALEVLGRFYGKLLTGTLTENDMKISKQPFFTRIMNAIKNFINGNFNLRTYLERNRENFFLEPGKEIKSKEIFYSLEQSEKITYSKMTNAIEKMTKSLKSRMSRTYKDETAPLGEYSKRLSTLQTQLDQVYKMKENLAYDSAFADFLKSLYVDTTNVFNFLEKYFNFSKTPASVVLKDVKFSTQDKIFIGKDETVNSSIIENNESNVIYTKYKLLNLKADADLSTLHYSQLSELREFLVYYDNFIREMGINNVKNSIINLDKLKDLNNLTSYVLESLKDIETAVSVLNSKKLPDTIDDLIEDTGIDTDIIPVEIMNALKDTNITNDVGMIEYLLGTTRDASQPILRLINAVVKNIMYIAKRSTLNFANPFLERLNHRIGQSMDWAYEKYNGKFTGYFISKHNYGAFQEEKAKFFKELNAKYNYPEDYRARDVFFSDIITKNNSVDYYKNNITELKLKIFNESNEDLKLKYLDDIADNEITIEKIETDYAIYKQYRNESSDWFNENTEPLDNIEEIINELFNDDKITESEKSVWLSNNTLKNDSGDIISYTNELVRPSDIYLNDDYKRLDSSQISDLEFIKQTKKDLDIYLPTKINNLAPQTYQSAIDTLMKTQLPELINKVKFLGRSTVVKQEDDNIGEITENIVDYQDETRIIKYNPTRYTRKLVEPNNISTDLLSSMIAYAKMVYEFKEKGDRIEQLEFVAQNIKSGQTLDSKRQESESTSGKNIMKQLENYLRVQIMGISYPDVVIPGININVTKMLKNAARFVTAKNLGLNFATQFVDNITSNLWYNIEKVMGDVITRKSSTLGFKAFKELAQDAVKESKTTVKNNKLSVILRTLGLSDNLHSVFNDLDKNILMRDIGNKTLFAGYRASNFFISGNAALSALYNYRLYNGKWYTEREFGKIQNPTEQFDSLPSAYDNIRIENGVMSIDGMKTNTFNLFSRRLNNLISKIDGKLTEEDKTYAHSTLIGIVTLIHRDWILDGISRRFKKKGVNFDANAVDEGYWRATGRFMIEFFADKEKIRNLKTLITKYNELDDSQKEGVRRTMYELMVVIGSITLAIIMNLGDDDDDRELDYLRDMVAYLSTRITMETTAFYNPFEYVYAVSDVFVVSRDFKKIISFTEMFNAKEIESGKWEGWTRSQKYFLQNVPGVTGALSLSNPEASNRFIINNVLGFAGGFDKFSYFSVPLIGSIDEEELKEIKDSKK